MEISRIKGKFKEESNEYDKYVKEQNQILRRNTHELNIAFQHYFWAENYKNFINFFSFY